MEQGPKRKAVILGATKGLGRELTILYQREGWKTIEIGSSATNMTTDDAIHLRCDMTSVSSVTRLIDSLKEISEIDRFYWVAGRMLRGNFTEHSGQEIFATIDVNFRNAAPIVQCVLNQMMISGMPTKFVAIASSAGKKAIASEAIYAATKFAQVGFVRSLGLEIGNSNTSVTLVLPGGMKTNLWNDLCRSTLIPHRQTGETGD